MRSNNIKFTVARDTEQRIYDRKKKLHFSCFSLYRLYFTCMSPQSDKRLELLRSNIMSSSGVEEKVEGKFDILLLLIFVLFPNIMLITHP